MIKSTSITIILYHETTINMPLVILQHFTPENYGKTLSTVFSHTRFKLSLGKIKTKTNEGMRYQSNKTSRAMNTATEEVRKAPFLNMTVFSYTKTAPVVIVDLLR